MAFLKRRPGESHCRFRQALWSLRCLLAAKIREKFNMDIDFIRSNSIYIDYCLQVISNDRTLNELWTSVSSRSMTMHFFPTSSARISGSSCFVDLLWLFCLESRHKSPDPDAPEPPIPLPTKDDSRPFFPFPFLFLPRQQIMEQSKLDLFFVSEIRLTWWNYNIIETPIILMLLYKHMWLFECTILPFCWTPFPFWTVKRCEASLLSGVTWVITEDGSIKWSTLIVWLF